jgi:hypothetical protein
MSECKPVLSLWNPRSASATVSGASLESIEIFEKHMYAYRIIRQIIYLKRTNTLMIFHAPHAS